MKPQKLTSDPAFEHRQLCRCGETKNQDWHLVCEKCWSRLPDEIKIEVYNAFLNEEGSERHKRAMEACFEVLDKPEVCAACLGWVGCNCPDCIKEHSEEVQEVVSAMQTVIVERDKAREYADELTAEYLEASGKLQKEIQDLKNRDSYREEFIETLRSERDSLREELKLAIEQRNHEQRCVEQKTRPLKHERSEVQFEEKRSHRFRKELDAARKVVEFVVNDGKGREFFPRNLDGTLNEMFVKATSVGSESFEDEKVAECPFCRGQNDERKAKCTHKIYDML